MVKKLSPDYYSMIEMQAVMTRSELSKLNYRKLI